MPETILHQYDVSPFSEKIRKIFAYKKIAWSAVEQPIVAPKPNLTALTGGYRRIPVMQIGADLYCDTALIARVLEERHPEPTIFPGGHTGAAEAIAHWADHWLFLAVVPPAVIKALPILPPEFIKDREALSPGFTAANLKRSLPDARSRLLVALSWLEAELSRRPFLLAETPGLADFACFHCLWFLRNDPESFAALESRRRLLGWFERIEALGQGARTDLDASEALAIAQRSRTESRERSDGTDPAGLRPGDAIVVAADDYGSDPIAGTAVVVTADEIALRREDPAAGEVVVHFPRVGYRASRAGSAAN